jgi:hypothetical protein
MVAARTPDIGTSTRAGAQTKIIRDYYGNRDEHGNRKYRLVEVVTSRSISVSLDCS